MKMNNVVFKGARGKLRDFFFRILRGQTHRVSRPTRHTRPSENQTASQAKFLAATQYALKQIEREPSKAMYSQGITDRKRSAYLVAVSDFMNAPIVHRINAGKYQGKIGNKISVRATDDFMVIAVKVTIKGNDGKILEEGEALPDPFRADIWKYKTSVANLAVRGTTISVVAYDLPGNSTSLEKVL